jgi:hypothetical protein
MRDDAHPTPPSEFGVRAYTLFGLAALLVMVLALRENNRDTVGALVVAALAAVALVARWSAGPPLLILGLIVTETLHYLALGRLGLREHERGLREDGLLMDGVLAAAVIGYSAALYRLVSLTRTIMYVDRRPQPRKRGTEGRRGSVGDGRRPRPLGQATPLEAALLAGAAAIAAAVVVATWMAADSIGPPDLWVQSYLDSARGRAGVRAAWPWTLTPWVLGSAALAAAFAAAYCGWRGATAEEARVYLQDLVWRETRRDQTRVNRWMTWRRLHGLRRKGDL